MPRNDSLYCHICGKTLKRSRRGGRPPKYCGPCRGTRPHSRTQPRLQLVPEVAPLGLTEKTSARIDAALDQVADALNLPAGNTVLTVLGGTVQRLAELDAAGTKVSPALRALVLRLAEGFETTTVYDVSKLATLSREFRAALVQLEPTSEVKRNADPFGIAELFTSVRDSSA